MCGSGSAPDRGFHGRIPASHIPGALFVAVDKLDGHVWTEESQAECLQAECEAWLREARAIPLEPEPCLMSRYRVFVWLNAKGQAGNFAIGVNTHAGDSFEYVESGWPRTSVCSIPVDAETQRISIRGELLTEGRRILVDRDMAAVDLAPVIGPLHASELTMSERVRGLVAGLDELSARTDGAYFCGIALADPDWTQSAVSSAETAHQFTFPAALANLMLSMKVTIDNSFSVAPSELMTVAAYLGMWGGDPDGYTGDVTMRGERVSMTALFQRSLVFFVEIGDGGGMLAFDPVRSVWFWMHQEFEAPRLLVNQDGTSWSTEEAICSIFWKLAFSDEEALLDGLPAYADGRDFVLFDSSNPRGKFVLVETRPGQVSLRLWNHDHSWFTL